MAIKTAAELASACKNVAKNYNTLYVMGCFGAPLTGANVDRYKSNHAYNRQKSRVQMISARANKNPPYYGFDCVCLIKGLLWGWNGDRTKTYGGAVYKSNNVPDINADQMIECCSDLSTDFDKIEVGEAVWCEGHIGIYVGDGLAVECSPKWQNCVQITACNKAKGSYKLRTWTKHGKLPYVSYNDTYNETLYEKTIEELALEVIDGVYGNGEERRKALGDKYEAVQDRVNEILRGEEKTIDELALEVIDGVYGNGEERRKALGDKYEAVQDRVNELLE